MKNEFNVKVLLLFKEKRLEINNMKTSEKLSIEGKKPVDWSSHKNKGFKELIINNNKDSIECKICGTNSLVFTCNYCNCKKIFKSSLQLKKH